MVGGREGSDDVHLFRIRALCSGIVYRVIVFTPAVKGNNHATYARRAIKTGHGRQTSRRRMSRWQQFRFNFTQIRGGLWGWSDAVQLSEVRFYGATGQQLVFDPIHGAVNPGGSSPWSNQAIKVIDNSLQSKWYAAGSRPPRTPISFRVIHLSLCHCNACTGSTTISAPAATPSSSCASPRPAPSFATNSSPGTTR